MVERSANGIDFESLGQVQGKGSSQTFEAYHFMDKNPYGGINYYRLKQVDINGSYSYSNTIAVYEEDSGFVIYPNPNEGSFSINIMEGGDYYHLEISDVQGRSVYSSSSDGIIPPAITVQNLSKGFYNVVLHLNDRVISKKLIVY